MQIGVRAEDSAAATPGDRVLTVPNALSVLRLLGVPLFLWLVLTEHDGWRRACSWSAASPTGWTARSPAAWNQMSRVGELLDPAADRLYILATLIGLTVRDVVPLWLTLALVGRDVFLATLPARAAPPRLRAAAGPLPRQGGHVQPALRLPAAAAG